MTLHSAPATTLEPFQEAHRQSCRELLAALPEWFGIEQSNREYIAALGKLPGAVALRDGSVVGFIALERHNPGSVEILVMAVDRRHHREGVGTALMAWAREYCIDNRVPWLHVKTRGPATPDAGYRKTRAFYLAQGFEPLFESLTLWGSEDAALILIQKVDTGGSTP